MINYCSSLSENFFILSSILKYQLDTENYRLQLYSLKTWIVVFIVVEKSASVIAIVS